jgi:acetyl esterase
MNDVRWSLTQRLVRTLLELPDWLLSRLVGPPVERDGRVLDRRVQLLLAFADRTGRLRRDLAVAPMRAELARLSRLGMPRIPSVDARDRRIDGPGGPIPVRVYRASGSNGPAPAIVFFHGGGWVCGDLESHDSSCRRLAMLSGCVVVSVDYRLAPEHPWPGAVDDALAAYAWVQQHPGELGIAPGRVGVMGDSAGGNLAAVVSLAARDAGLPLPVAQGLIYPAVDMEFSAASHASVGVGFGLEQRTMHWFREQYVPDPADWRNPRVSPLYAADLTGLPPALVVTAGFDPLRDEGDAYAEALVRAGVPVRHLRYDAMIHGFFGMGMLPGGLDRAAEICIAMGELMQPRA